MEASLQTAHAFKKGAWLAGHLRQWTQAYLENHEALPVSPYGTWNSSVLEDEDFSQELQLHLQGIGKYVRAMDIVEYLDKLEVKAKLRLTKTIHLTLHAVWGGK